MCGIFGYTGKSIPSDEPLKKALNLLSHRGPDDYGIHTDYETGQKLWMGHRRLSIIDLSKAGRQPFVTPDNKVAVSVNGEIYNHTGLRTQLEAKGAVFKSQSDSEVLLWGFYYEGEAFFNKLRGMFAAAIWDRKRPGSPRLLLVRDRMGIKPLYYYHKNNAMFFASELKALASLKSFPRKISFAALEQYLVFGYIPAPATIYTDTYKLSPGEYVVFQNGTCKKNTFWQIKVPRDKFSGSEREAEKELEKMLYDSVSERLMSDVPIGAFLSGGIDSSIVCAIAQKIMDKPLKTFTIGFESSAHDESGKAEEIAKYLGTDHSTTVMGRKEILNVLPDLTRIYDEPFMDISIFPTILLSEITRKQVTVALSGDGGDELFFGYNSFPAHRKISKVNILPKLIRKTTGNLIQILGGAKTRFGMLGKALSFDKFDEAYLMEAGIFHRLYFKQLTGHDFQMDKTKLRDVYKRFSNTVPDSEICPYLDMSLYLPDDILCKIDRAAMACALEVRVPILDHRIVEFACSLPAAMKYSPRKGGKIILKNILAKHIPEKLWNRKKQGFSPPIGDWLKKELKELMRDYLSPEKIRQEGLFSESFIFEKMKDHLSGKKNNQDFLWNLLHWEMWKNEHKASF
jgi:asparagine synthase (glutamine-hydrolysing)